MGDRSYNAHGKGGRPNGGKGNAHTKGGGGGKGGRPQSAGGPYEKPSKEARKEGRRSKQLMAQEKKGEAEANLFKDAQREALKSGAAAQARQGLSAKDATAKEAELFATQGAQGINFASYDAITVEVNPPPPNPRDRVGVRSDSARRGVARRTRSAPPSVASIRRERERESSLPQQSEGDVPASGGPQCPTKHS